MRHPDSKSATSCLISSDFMSITFKAFVASPHCAFSDHILALTGERKMYAAK
jgi:hypothetical protein